MNIAFFTIIRYYLKNINCLCHTRTCLKSPSFYVLLRQSLNRKTYKSPHIKFSMVVFDISNVYVQTAILLVITYLATVIIIYVLEKFSYKLTQRTKTKIDDLILEKTHKSLTYIIFLVGMRFAITPLNLTANVDLVINNLFNTSIVIFLLQIALGIADVLINEWGRTIAKKTKSTMDDDLLPLILKTSNAALYIFGLIFILSIWNIDVTGLLAGMGIAGIAIGFAVRDSLANIFGGISIVLDKAYKVGDKIRLESGDLGIVHDIGLRSTKLRTFDNQILTIPNAQMANSKILNYTQPTDLERVNVEFSTEYGSNVDKVKKVALEVIKKHKDSLKDPAPAVVFTEMGDFALKFTAKFWVDDYNKAYGAKLDTTKAMYDALNKEKIGIPFPTQTVHVNK